MNKKYLSYFISSLLLVALAVYLFNTDVYVQQPVEEVPAVLDTIPEISMADPEVFYGIIVDSLDIIQKRIRWGQNLADILKDYQIDYGVIHKLADRAKGVFDVRKLVAGKDYYLVVNRDSLRTANYFIFEPSPYEYVIYGLQDSIFAFKGLKPVGIEERTFTGVIESSVYETMVENGGSPELVNRLVDVFAWQVDFFRIQKGDKIKIVYEVELVDGQAAGIGRIKGAYFEHFGEEYYAVHYNQGSGVDYFDQDGNSLRKTFLKAPLNYSRISSRYSGRRYHPVLKRYKSHLGTDYAAPSGTPIRTVGDGVVIEATYNKGNGNYVKVKHNSTYSTQYLHMSKIATGIRPGVRVSQGQTIGFVGSSGLATGPHLCFRFWKGGRQVDALKVDIPPSEPISEKHRNTYDYVRAKMVQRLDELDFEKPVITEQRAQVF